MEITKIQLEFLKGNLDINKCNLRDLEIGTEEDGTRYFKSNKSNIKYTEFYVTFGLIKSYMIIDENIEGSNKILIAVLNFAGYGKEIFIRDINAKNELVSTNLENKNMEDILQRYNVKILEEVEV